ncbi:hypothetical protein N9933_02075 [bacterium]|nr:hypothetical protein [bacterium]
MKSFSLSIILLICFSSSLFGKKILGDLNFQEGKWAIVGIPLHNYKFLPIQSELGTFIIKNKDAISRIQYNWDLEPTFEDKCDYHYSLKFYKDNILVRTVKLNLFCGYLTWDGLSYEFGPINFEEFKASSNEIEWSRITFSDLNLLEKAVKTLDSKSNVYWYEDVSPYYYPGYFMVGVNRLPWNVNMDSLDREIHTMVATRSSSDAFYLKKYFHVIRNDRMYVRYLVNCSEEFSYLFPREDQYLQWRSHLHGRDSVRIVAIGVDQEKYRRLMRGN